MTTVGVVGLGRMGGAMARRLLETGFEVVGHDVRPDPVGDLVSAGGAARDDPAGVAADAEVVVTSLPGPAAVEAVLRGPDGVLETAAASTVLETSTSAPETTVALASTAADAGVQLVDAPVSGGPGPAADGTLTVLLGCSPGDLESPATDVVEALAARSFHLGEVGAGHTAKLLNNVCAMGNLAIALEALALGAARGVDVEALSEVVTHASGASAQLEKRGPRVMNRHFEAGFPLELARKDLGLALDLADAAGYPMLAARTVSQLYAAAGAAGHGAADAAAVVKLFESLGGAEVASASEVDETFDGY